MRPGPPPPPPSEGEIMTILALADAYSLLEEGEKMTILALAEVSSVVEEFKKICSDCFLSGSYRFGRATAKSDMNYFRLCFK